MNDDIPFDALIVEAKIKWARQGRKPYPPPTSSRKDRLPPGQHEARGWPVLDLGITPTVTPETFRLDVTGLVDRPRSFTFDDLMALPQTEDVSDFHCVTTWSTFDNRWAGIRFRDLCRDVGPKASAAFVTFGSYDGYTTNLPFDACVDDDVLIVHAWNGRPLERVHGGPFRMIVPKRYAWKSAKWLRSVEFHADDRPGFWEVRGYSNTAFPFDDDRFSR